MIKYIALISVLAIAGCSSIPMATPGESMKAKEFAQPAPGKAGLYVYRDGFLGAALKKDIHVNNECIGASKANVFFYKEIEGDKDYEISTESEFSPNKISLHSVSGKNHFVRQYIKIGVFVGGADLEIMEAGPAMQAISRLDMGVNGSCGM